MTILHGPSYDPEFTLCGLAFDAFDSGDCDSPIVFAQIGERVTCDYCIRVIEDVRHGYTKAYTVKGGTAAKG